MNKKTFLIDCTVLFSLLTYLIIMLERIHPYYFLNDDNRTFYLPLFVHNLRAVMNGELPLFNFHQYLGIAHFSDFQSAIFYPLTYISQIISKLIAGHEYWTIDLAVYIHFLIGALGFYHLILSFTKNRLSSIFGGLVWVINSFSIYISNSWWILSGVTAWFPWIILFGFKFYQEGRIKNLSLLILFRLLLFYVGHIEYFVYCLIFEFLTIFLLGTALKPQKMNFSFIRKYAFGYLITLIYTLPILLPGWFRMISSGIRSEHFDFAVLHANALTFGEWIKGLFNPFNLDQQFYWRDQSKFSFGMFPHLSHIGYITSFLVIFSVVFVWLNKKFHAKIQAMLAVMVLFVIALFWSFGLLAEILYHIPLLNRFRFPFKLLCFGNFYLIFTACFGFSFFSRLLPKNHFKHILPSALIVAVLLNFYLLYTNVFISMNNRAHFDRIPLQEPLAKQLKSGRIFSLAEPQADPFSVRTMGFNYPLLFGLNHFGGYDPLMPKKNYQACLQLHYRDLYKEAELPLGYLRQWGVKWYILNKDPEPDVMCFHYRSLLDADSSIAVFAEESQRTIFYDSSANPLFYWKETSSPENIEVMMSTNSVQIKAVSRHEQTLIINYLFDDFFRAELNQSSKIGIRENEIGQMELTIPAGENQITIKYVNPYFHKGFVAVLLTSLIIALYWIRIKKCTAPKLKSPKSAET